jgi:hypothetical protein
MKKLLFFTFVLLFGTFPLKAECPRNSTIEIIFYHLEDGAYINIDGQVWMVSDIKAEPGFLEDMPKKIESLAQEGLTPYADLPSSKMCSYDAFDRFGKKKTISMSYRYKLMG